MDIGSKDLTVVLFAYYDFKNGVLVVEDEIVMNGPSMTTDKLAAEIKAKEKKLWTNPVTLEVQPPLLRVADNNLIMINDLRRLHDISFIPTKKDDKIAALNTLRMKIANREIYINPRCKTLVAHIRHATWNKARTAFTRSRDKGHYDALDSLTYMVRNINYNKNPYPPGYGIGHGSELFHSGLHGKNTLSENAAQFSQLWNNIQKKRVNK